MKAFPFESSMPEVYGIHTGMDLRDYFAIRILPTLINNTGLETFRLINSENSRNILAVDAYKMADAMMKAREQ